MNKKNFEEPVVEIISIEISNVIATSNYPFEDGGGINGPEIGV